MSIVMNETLLTIAAALMLLPLLAWNILFFGIVIYILLGFDEK